MLYLGIDQHARQITISLRDESGDVLQPRQVSTQPAKINAFFQQLTRERLRNDEQFVAVLEVCGFNDWLIRMRRARKKRWIEAFRSREKLQWSGYQPRTVATINRPIFYEVGAC